MADLFRHNPKRARILAVVFALLLGAWVAQLFLLQPLPLVYSKDYWQTVSPLQLRVDITLKDIDIGSGDTPGAGPAHWAAAWATDPELVEILLDAGAKIDAVEPGSGRQPVHLAALNPHPGVIEALIGKGADINARESQQLSPLHLAATSNPNPAVSAALIRLGADVDATDGFGNTPLHKAATSAGAEAAIQALIDNGADLSAVNNSGYRPLEMAIKENASLAIAKKLIEQTPRALDEQNAVFGRNLLHLAAGSNPNPGISAHLIELGIDIKAVDDNGLNAAHHSAGVNPEAKVLATLIANGADIHQRAQVDEYTPLHYAAALNPSAEVASALIEAGADANIQVGRLGSSPLHLCLIGGNSDEVCAYLAELDGQMRLRTADGFTAIHLALHGNRDPDLLRRFIELGSDLDAPSDVGISAMDLIERKRLSAALGLD